MAALTRALGRTIRYNHIPLEVFAGCGFPGAEDLADMFEFYRAHVPSRRSEIEKTRALYPKLRRFEDWAQANRERLIGALQG